MYVGSTISNIDFYKYDEEIRLRILYYILKHYGFNVDFCIFIIYFVFLPVICKW